MTRKVLNNRKILLAVTGSVAAYRSIELARTFRKGGAEVRVVMTPAAARFVTPLSLQIASENEVVTDLFDSPLAHIELPRWAEAMVVAPATADTIARFASASASDIVSACFLACGGPVIVAPAMNWRMYSNTILQEKIAYLKEKGVIEVPPERGELACGEEGTGRLAGVEGIVSETVRAVTERDMDGRRIVVTAGPTREPMDPVRFISNRSSGKMGYAIARNAFFRGAEVILVSGPTAIEPPYGVYTEYVETAAEMMESVERHARGTDVLIMAAAVADYAPAEREEKKMEKKERLELRLMANEDIIGRIARLEDRPLIVGFAAETGAGLERARRKMREKNMDMVVFNDVSLTGSGFDVDTNEVTIIDREGEKPLPLMPKDEVAWHVLDRVVELLT